MTAAPWNEEAWTRLRERRERGAMPHALMLAGPAGLGKRAFAERLVRAMLCNAPADGDACGQCKACRLLDAGTHPDRVHVTFELNSSGKPRKEIVVGQMRALSERLAMASQFDGWQVAVIDPADAMNTAAANALLKTLEEPVPSSVLVLVCDAPWRLPATIRSRCQRVDFRLPPREQALQWLTAQGVTDAPAALAAAGGNPGLAQSWADAGLLAERQQVAADLASLARGNGSLHAVAQRWLDDALAQRLTFAARLVADESAARGRNAKGVLDSRLSADGLARWFDRANHTREALRGPLRPDLMVLDLLSHWR